MTTLDSAQVLEDAADVLLIHGRCTATGHDSVGRFCTLGAVAEAIEPGWHQFSPCRYWGLTDEGVGAEAVSAVARRVRQPWSPSEDAMAVYWWNDDHATSHDEVRDTLLLAAKDLRNES